MRLTLIVLAALATWTSLGDEFALSRVGDWWSYLPGTNEPDATWTQPGFDDSSWSLGRSGFSAAYGGSDATTLPLQGTPYTTVYFRRRLILPDAGDVHWLTLRIDYADGFVAYLNGREVARRNLVGAPGTLAPFDRLAANPHPRFQPEEIDLTLSRDALVTGTNVLALQLHSAQATNSALALSAELMANFNRAPVLQNTSSNSVQIVWKTPVPAQTRVEFGADTRLDQQVSDTNLVTTHVATLTNLIPGLTYSYRPSSTVGEVTAAGALQSFRTFNTTGAVRFIVFADGGWNGQPQFQIADVMAKSGPDFVLEAGDIIYPSFTRGLVDLHCFSVYEPQMRTTPFFFALGNHDLLSGVTNYLDAFYLPTNSVSLAEHAAAGTSPEHYYSFDAGEVHFVVLFVPYLSQYRLSVGDPQYRWLTNDLASTRQPWKIAFYHVPMNSSSAHRLDDLNGNGVPDRLEIRDVLLPVLSKYGVQLAFSGHEHGYERFNPTNGVHFITTAGGGIGLYGFTELDVASALYWARFNCVQVTIDGNRLEAEALGIDGQPFDSMSIQRQLPPPQTYVASWGSPALDNPPSNDGDGNVLGQAFAFSGQPIPTLPGQFSNLGRVHVNNDAANLYIGLDRVMIYGNNNIFLFVESPRLSGVTDLKGLGNGRIDPTGQGVDGLDFLENLSFENFKPSVGCVLGDEFGDGQSRSFARKQLALNIGQGIFRLDPELSDVTGTVLQQFHLSPQVASMPGEENAGFIELAIPLTELGGVQPGEVIKLAAIVAGPEVDVAQQARSLDTGYLGASFTANGLAPAVLEGVPVRLAVDPARDQDGDGLTNGDEQNLGTDPMRADTDGDGLPDGWEVAHGLNPLAADGADGGAGDPDGDGFSNQQEYVAGTDPRDSGSALQLQIESTRSGGSRLWWIAMPGRRYQVQMSLGSVNRFEDIPGGEFDAVKNGMRQSFELPSNRTEPSSAFYRVRVVE